ncbi:periplasmic protein involved in polysaccharide export [Burkholderia sp. Ch1-1]|uniref:Periplasmic protein involved in polysaccharide export n=1 Tax=Paraburkholderia dioscoreae TaxID=2604047 RepID=A0A5Q4ZSP8_9BURK|nr:periplasmic protein involved in polysaccharide export [Burkholderia sp. Ch1-1]VVD32140.1 Periplasmic protein involved in polysaccharide export [Paraburkholderia dioscoreae]
MLAVFLTRPAFRLGVLTTAVAVLSSACAVAPGMRMETSRVQGTSGASGTSSIAGEAVQGAISEKADATAGTPDIAITEVDAELLSQLARSRKQQQLELSQLLSGEPQAYTVGAGDVLQIVVWDHPEFAAALGSSQTQSSSRPGDPLAGFVVDQNGSLTFPYAGTLRVAGLRTEEIQQRLSGALGRYLVKPQVTVRMASYRAHQVYVDGEVHSPGALAVNDVPMTLYEAVGRAGGFSEAADQSDLVLVRGERSYRVNLTQMLAQGLSPSRLYLKPGDLLRVVSRDENGAYVMGEVNKPVSAIPRRTGRMTLADALSQAGSVNASTADAAQMFVIRGSLTGSPQVFHLDGHSPVAMLLAKDFELQPKDVVYVDGSGLVRFNRVLSLLMPLISTGLTAGVIAK